MPDQPVPPSRSRPDSPWSQLFARKSIDKLIADSERPEHALKKTLGPVSLTALGIGAVIGSGIFTVIGTAIAGQQFPTASIENTPLIDYIVRHSAMLGRPGAGPALALSLVLVALVCAFTGLCYAELASMIPIAGSAYTYTYATMGELIAWIIGWDLILEYAFSNMSVSVGFAAHLVDLLDWFGIHPALRWISPAYLPEGLQDLAGKNLYDPGWHFGFNIPAFLIVMLLTVVLVRGIRESARTNNIMVLVKIAAILIFIGFGASFIHPAYYHPFSPNGWSGVLTGGSIIFFTYIGFDSVSTAAEECKNPQRDVPIGILATLAVCTVLYIGVAVVLTGMVPWRTVMGDAAPVVNALKRLSLLPGGHRLHWIRLFVVLGAITGMISSILVFQLGQARVWFSMSRDRLLPAVFSHVHPKFRTPAVATWVAGVVVGVPAGLLDIGTVSNLSNIGTLFAFVLVSAGVLILRYREPNRRRGFRAPFGPVFPILSIIFCIILMMGLEVETWFRFFIWLGIGLVIYFTYSRHRSEFAKGR
ncbi:MAG TPA: amino acid permease [Acidobacteriaceae bacterium]|nr:amino acid permease [Acidobacteriaceae bacterium]